MKRVVIGTIAALALAVSLRAQESGLTVDGNFLTRGEIRAGGISGPGDEVPDRASFILERTLLGLRYDVREGLAARVTAQHSGTWGSVEGNTFNLYEAWFRLYTPKGFFAQIGRQNLSYDDQRIFGADDWAMTARSHDALKLGYEGYGHKVHLIGAYNQNPANISGGSFFSGGLQPYQNMQALWYHYDIPGTCFGASLLGMNAGMQGGSSEKDGIIYYQQLVGTFLSYRPKKWSVEAAYYRQMGKEEHGLPVDAWMASVKGKCALGSAVGLYGGYDYLSGDPYFAVPAEYMLGMTRHEVIRGFSSLYGSHHKFYGAMDFFYVTTYVNGFTPGLQNAYLGVKGELGSFTLDGAFHYLATSTKLEAIGMSLGYELELSVQWQLRKDASLGIGYSYMRGTETMEALKRTSGKRQLQWGWLMLVVTPKFFSSK